MKSLRLIVCLIGWTTLAMLVAACSDSDRQPAPHPVAPVAIAPATSPATAPAAHDDDDDHDHPNAGPVEPATRPLPEPSEHATTQETATEPADPTKPLIQPLKDGSFLVDRQYQVAGTGTQTDPYQIHWDLLLSAKETYNPATGKWELPPRITMLDGKYVQIRGYLAVPVYTRHTDRILLTWSMIDACHGTKPKPYEALEVKLDSAIDMEPHTLTIMLMTGKLALDPQLQNGWLLSMYQLGGTRIDAIEK